MTRPTGRIQPILRRRIIITIISLKMRKDDYLSHNVLNRCTCTMTMMTMMMMKRFVGCLLVGLWTSSAEYQGGTPHQSVVHLDDASFHEAIKDPANPFWFLKFYAPWCGHCKRMAPVLDSIAPKLEGKMAIGKIDCTVHKKLCGEFKIRGYPTLKFSVDGELSEYSGGRDEAALTAFAAKMSGPAVHVVQNYAEAFEFASKETSDGVAFLGFDPTSSAEEMTAAHQIFSQVARQQQASAYFVWMNPGQDERTYPFIHKIEAGVQPKSYEDHDVKIASLTTESLTAWVKSNNVPLVVEMGPNNFNRIGKSGRPLAMSVVDFDNAAQKKAIKEHMLSYASNLSTKDADKYYFGIIDGKKWAKFLEQFKVVPEDNPQMIVMDVPTKTFWQNSTYKNMVEFMKAIDEGEIEKQVATKPEKTGTIAKMEAVFVDNFPWSLIVLLLLIFGMVFLLVPSADDMRPPYDKVSGDGEVIGDGDGAASSETKKDK